MNPAPHYWFYVYLLKSKKNNSIYIGCTSDLNKRLQKHREGRNYSTKGLLPLELVYFEAYKSKKDAFRREKHLKYYSSALRNLKIRLEDTFNPAPVHRGGIKKGGAG